MLRRLLALCFTLTVLLPPGAPAQTPTYANRTLMANAGTYSSTITYAQSDVVQAGGAFYISVAANNVGNPVTDTTHWQPWSAQGSITGGACSSGQVATGVNAAGVPTCTAITPSALGITAIQLPGGLRMTNGANADTVASSHAVSCIASGSVGMYYSSCFPAATIADQVNACIQAADGYTCVGDLPGGSGSQYNSTHGINVASASGTKSVKLQLLPQFEWPFQITDGTSCGIKVFNSGTLEGSGVAAEGGRAYVESASATVNMDSLICNDTTVSGGGYVKISGGLIVRNLYQGATFTNAAGAIGHFENLNDETQLADLTLRNNYGSAGYLNNIGCGASAHNLHFYASRGDRATGSLYTGGGTPLTFSGSNLCTQAFTAYDSTFNAPGPTKNNITVLSGAFQMKNSYLEGNGPSGDQTAMVNVAAGALGFSWDGGSALAFCLTGAQCPTKQVLENHTANYIHVSGVAVNSGYGQQYIQDFGHPNQDGSPHIVPPPAGYGVVGTTYEAGTDATETLHGKFGTVLTGKHNRTFLVDDSVTSCSFPAGSYTDPLRCAIAAADAAWDATGQPQAVDVDAAVYPVNGPVVLRHAIAFRGRGKGLFGSSGSPSGGTIIRAAVPMQDVLATVAGGNYLDLNLTGFTLDGNGMAQRGLYLPTVGNAHLDDLGFMGLIGSGAWAVVGDRSLSNGYAFQIHSRDWFFYYPSGGRNATVTATVNADGTLTPTLTDGGQYRRLFNAEPTGSLRTATPLTVTGIFKSTQPCPTPAVWVGNLVPDTNPADGLYTMGSVTVSTAAAGCPVGSTQAVAFPDQPQAATGLLSQATDSDWTSIANESVGTTAGILSLGGQNSVWLFPHFWGMNIGMQLNGSETVFKAENDSTYTAGVYINQAVLGSPVDVSLQPTVYTPALGTLGAQGFIGAADVLLNANAGIPISQNTVTINGKLCRNYNAQGLCTGLEQVYDAITVTNPTRSPVSSSPAGAYGSIYPTAAITPLQYGGGSFSNIYAGGTLSTATTGGCLDLPYYDAAGRTVTWDATGNILAAGSITSGHTLHACWFGYATGQTGKWTTLVY